MRAWLGIVLLLSLWSGSSLAEGTPAGTPAAASSPEWNEIKGEKLLALSLKGNPLRGKDAFEPCQSCHKRGATGTASGAYPRLAGQHASVLIEQMVDIRYNKRLNLTMEPFSDEHVISPQQIADIAAYLQGLAILPNKKFGTGTDLKRGKDLYVKDCAECHGDQGEGIAKKFYPMVAAQNYKYLLRENRFIRDGLRGNANPEMVKVIKPYSDGDLEAVADYMSRLEAP